MFVRLRVTLGLEPIPLILITIKDIKEQMLHLKAKLIGLIKTLR
jgi:hypothetical protein